jgi:hypothetical protein
MCASERDGQRAQARAMPTLSFAFTSAPFASSALTRSEWPFRQAAMSGVLPFCGAGEHRGQRLPPPSSRGPPACPHQLTPSVEPTPFALLPPAPRPPRSRAPPPPRAPPSDRGEGCTAPAAVRRRRRSILTRVRTRVRPRARASYGLPQASFTSQHARICSL